MERNKNKTVEEMIAEGASWAEIKAYVKEMQDEYNRKKQAEAAAEKQRMQQAEVAKASRERFIEAFLDWMIAEDVLDTEDREEFRAMMDETADRLLTEMKQMLVIQAILLGR